MKEFKGTKGNWYLQDFTDAYTNIVRCDRGKGFSTYYICATSQDTSPETRYNAQLIATAPELLECLKECLSEIEDRCVDSSFDPDTYPIVIKTKALINKALGV